jgi:hypothetical protein
MTTKYISYKDGYKYQLDEGYKVEINIIPDNDIGADKSHYIQLDTPGHLAVTKGYAWDGPSGPTFGTENFMRGSLVHDALYQLMRQGHLDPDKYRETADDLLRTMCREDGRPILKRWDIKTS